MQQVFDKYLQRHAEDEWRFDLRIRYLPTTFKELCDKDYAVFSFYYEQVRSDYYAELHTKIDQELALQLCCFEIRKYLKNMTSGLDKKSTLEYLDREVGLQKFIPPSLSDKIKPKMLKKHIQSQFKKLGNISAEECMLHFLEKLKLYTKFDQERFQVDYGTSPSFTIPIELIIGPDIGIHATSARSIDFKHIKSLHVEKCEESPKVTLKLKLTTSTEIICFNCVNLAVAESLADLIDGYCRLHSDRKEPVWKLEGLLLYTASTSLFMKYFRGKTRK